MSIRVALNHSTTYRFDRLVGLSPHSIRLRPASHCRTPILSYSLKVWPQEHFFNWQQDPQGNLLARLVFHDKAREMRVDVDLIADMTVINPFDFFIESSAEQFPFQYEPWLAKEVRPFLEVETAGPKLTEYLNGVDRSPQKTIDFLVELNRRLQGQVNYVVRLEPGIQTCEQTLTLGSGSCRDTSWLLVQILRNIGLAARFVSGYLIQLKPDVEALDGPVGTDKDFTDLHAWAEVYIPGAGWIGLDPTSGLLAGEGHIPLACTPDPVSAAPVTGTTEVCETDFQFSMSVTRIHEDPRVTKPYTDQQWSAIESLGNEVDQRLTAGDVRLTMGGEPTFVSIDDMEGAEWNTAAVGPAKQRLSVQLIQRLQDRFAPGGLLHFGQGKWYPGEPLPRWALSCMWRTDGQPLWNNPQLLSHTRQEGAATADDARQFVEGLAEQLGVEKQYAQPAYEDVWHHLAEERHLPVNVDAADSKLKDPEQRARLAKVIERGLGEPVGYIMPLKRQWWQAQAKWTSSSWPFRSGAMFLLPGDSPIGLRLPLDSLPWRTPAQRREMGPVDPSIPREPLPPHPGRRPQPEIPSAAPGFDDVGQETRPQEADGESEILPQDVIHTALCVEPRDGWLHIFMPPVERLDDYLDLLAAIEQTAGNLDKPVVIEGYLPPADHRLKIVKITPDPGVIEVNIHPAHGWDELVQNTTTLYEEARLSRLGTEKFDLDGRHTGTGGGNHIVLGGPTPLDSPFVRRPDLLASLVAYWNNHPSLSYLFSGSFIGPTSQAPRVDEGRRDALYELELALQQLPSVGDSQPWLVDRLFRNLLVDLTGNTHRAEFCIDKLYSPDTSTGRLGLVEFRGFEMPPHARMSLTQQLLLRALVARFWETPYREKAIHWGTTLHDRFLLPEFIGKDFCEVINGLRQAGFPLEADWFAPHFEFRFPAIGTMERDGIRLELRQAIEPWYVLGEEPAGGSTSRFVDSSVERLQVKVNGLTGARHVITCNRRKIPLHPTGTEGEFVAGVRYRAWQPPSCLQPTIPVHTPLVFDVLDTWNSRSLGGCTYHVSHPGGRSYDTFPVNAYEAESRRASRFTTTGHTAGTMQTPKDEPNPQFPLTLDLRRQLG